MLVASSGNTALQSVMPAIGREIGIGDFWVAIAYTWSAVLWVGSPLIGRRRATITAARRSRSWASAASSSRCCCAGSCCSPGLHGWIGGALTFGLFALFRAIYGGLGCATPSATQAYLASKTRRSGRVAAFRRCRRRSGSARSSARRSRRCSCFRWSAWPGRCSRLRHRAGGRGVDRPVASQRPRRAQDRAWRGDELSLARDSADRRQRGRRDRTATASAG